VRFFNVVIVAAILMVIAWPIQQFFAWLIIRWLFGHEEAD
jgi:hypothetical protein